MFNMKRLQRWALGIQSSRGRTLVFCRPTLNGLEDRLPPGDMLYSNLFAGGLGLIDRFLPVPDAAGFEIVRPSGDGVTVHVPGDPLRTTADAGRLKGMPEVAPVRRSLPVPAVAPVTARDPRALFPLGEDTSIRFVSGPVSLPPNPGPSPVPVSSSIVGSPISTGAVSSMTALVDLSPVSTPVRVAPSTGGTPADAPSAASDPGTAGGDVGTAADPAPAPSPVKLEKADGKAVKPTHFYWAEGRPIGMTIDPDRVAIGLDESQANVSLPGELQRVRTVNSDTSVYEAPGAGGAGFAAQLAATPGVTHVAPVFVIQETQSEAVLLDEVIVALKPGVSPESFFTGDSRFTTYRPLLGTPDQFIATASAGFGEAALELANTLAADPDVAWTSPNFYQNWQRLYTPNDPRFGNLWHLHNTGQGPTPPALVDADSDLPEAWDINQGGSSNIVIAVVDDGVPTNHPDLLNWVNSGESGGVPLIDDDGNGWADDLNGWNFVNNNAQSGPIDPIDEHGTAVAGVAAARGDNGVGVTGASYRSPVMSVKIFQGNSVASDANLASAMYYSAGRTANGLGTWRGADIVNNSWGGGGVSTAINNALVWGTTNGRQGKGATFLFASGNGYTLGVIQPAAQSANIPGVIAVGATNNGGTRSDYSNYGPQLDFVTPSNDTRANYLAIDTTDRIGADGYANGDYTGTGTTGFGGTSSATPLASGIAGLVQAQADVLNIDLSPAQLRALLRNSTDLIGGASYDIATGKNLEYGFGRLNAATAVGGVGKAEVSVVTTTAEVLSGSGIVNFGSVVIGASRDVTLRVRNQGTETLNLSNLSVASGPFTIVSGFSDSSLAIGEWATFTGRFAPTAGGPIDRTVTFTSNDTDEGTFSFTYRGTGLVPSIAGTAYEDWNGNGTRDANDTGIAGRTVYLDTNGNSSLDFAPSTFSNNTALPIPDLSTVTSTINVSGTTGSVFDINVRVNITHTYDSDLDVYLIAPDGTRVELFSAVGADGENFINTVLDDEAATAITAGTAPFTGSYRPMGSLATLDGKSPNGTWTLEITDAAGGDIGTLNNWDITIAISEPVSITDSNGFYSFVGLANGPYTVRTIVPTGWVATGPAGGSYSETITSSSDSFVGRDFGSAKNNRFYGWVWNDQNANGTADSGEPPVAGRRVYLDANGNGSYDGGSSSFSNNSPLAIQDTATVNSTINVSGVGGPISDINVRVNITHTWDADLDVFLVAPDGTRVELFTDVGGSGDNFTNTVLDDEAATAITAGTAPFTGSYRPEGSLATLDGKVANGTWTLEITDDAGGDVGTLNNWELVISADELSVLSAANGNAPLDLPAGPQTIRIAPLTGWKFTNPANGTHSVTAAGAPLYDRRFGVAESVPPTVANVAITPSGAQRSRVDSLVVTFSERVVLPGTPTAAFTLTRAGGGTVTLNASVDDSGPATVVTLTFADHSTFGSLNDGDYIFRVLAAQVMDSAQNLMTADYETGFHRLFGDINGDRYIDGTDGAQFGSTFGLQTGDTGFLEAFDYNDDGYIDGTDGAQFGSRFGTNLPS